MNARREPPAADVAYAELQITSNFSFLRGGSHPEELVLRAAELGLPALALTDRNTLAGVVRAHIAAKEVGIRFVVGARLDLMPEHGADRSSAMKAATDSEDSPRTTAAADSEVPSPGILGFAPVLASERDGDPCLSPGAAAVSARRGKPQLDLSIPQARPQTNDIDSDHGRAYPAKLGDEEEAVPSRVLPTDARHAAPAPSASNASCGAAAILALPSSTSANVSHGRPVDDLLTSRRSGSAPHAMVRIRAPAAERPRRSDSHHSPRHGLNVPDIGERRINIAPAIGDGEEYEISNSAASSGRDGKVGVTPRVLIAATSGCDGRKAGTPLALTAAALRRDGKETAPLASSPISALASSASNASCSAATIPTLPSSTSPDARHARAVDDLLTSRRSGSAPRAMVGIRAPAAEQPRRSDSHHSPRHYPNVPGIGEQRVNVATGVSDISGGVISDISGGVTRVATVGGSGIVTGVSDAAAGISDVATGIPEIATGISEVAAEISELEESEAPSANVAPDFNRTTVLPWAGSGSTRPSAWPAERPAPGRSITARIHGAGSTEPGCDQQGAARENESGDDCDPGQPADVSRERSRDGANGYSLLCFPTDRAAYGRLSQLISLGQRRALKGACRLWLQDVLAHAEGQILVVLPPECIDQEFVTFLQGLRGAVAGSCYLAAQHLYRGDDSARIEALAELADVCGTPLVATGDVLYHTPARRPLQDVLTCIREHCTIDQAGYRLAANAERHLKPGAEMARLFAGHPEALARTREIADACRFSLDELRYEYPIDPAPAGLSVQAYLEQLTWAGARERYPGGIPAKVQSLLEHEFALITELDYAPYFLTVYDIVRYARSRSILCQGRGSAANSAVCYCLGITAVDPERFDLLFERFVSTERKEPPDIDVDFEHERREEVIQYVYAKYGRAHAGIAATVIHYRARSAIREVGKALGLSADAVGALASGIWGWSEGGLDARLARERGLDPAAPRLRQALELAGELTGFPRHLSQHVGGFVLTRSRLDQVVPVVNAAMAERTMVEWDKDDLDALGILKIDVLALGMLTCVRKAFELLERHYGRKLDLASVPPEDPAVYDMLGRADSIGVFQVESRAQMTMLPRLRPRCFYDLVIEVAIVRPGPIQGDMVHPYLRRRSGLEPVAYPSAALQGVLEKTLGVPLFQEQAMQIAIVGAGFTPSEADRLRRAMATFKRVGTIHTFRGKFIDGMVDNGYAREFAERCFQQIEGFGTYGFPESHAASFALLVYVSSWLKCHYPEAFACALLNSQPMGFYAPAQIVRDARDHDVIVLPVDVNASDWDCTLEPDPRAAQQGGELAGLSSEHHPQGRARGNPGEQRMVATRPPPGLHPHGAGKTLGGQRQGTTRFPPEHHPHAGAKPDGQDRDTTRRPGDRPHAGRDSSSSSPHDGPVVDRPITPITDRTVNGWSTIGAPPSASHAMVGSRARSPEQPRRSDSHHSPRHDPSVAADGKREVKAATAISGDGVRVTSFPASPAVSSSRISPLHSDKTVSARRSDLLALGRNPRLPGGEKLPESNDIGRGDDTHLGLGDGRNPTTSRAGRNEAVMRSAAAGAMVDGSEGEHDRGAVPAGKRALRLGLRQVKGLRQEEMARLVAQRGAGYRDLADLRRRAGVSAAALDRLARADAFGSLELDRRGALWRAIGLDRTGRELDLPPLFAWAEGRTAPAEPGVALPRMTLGQEVAEDYASLRLTLRRHPLALLRPWLDRRVIKAERLAAIDDGRRVEVAGLVLVRQRPGTASGVIFITIEDESGIANLIVWPAVFERFRRIVLGAQLMLVRGKVQKEGLVIHIVAETLIDRTDLLRRLAETDHGIDAPVARADRVKRPDDSGPRRRRSTPFVAPLAHADHAKNSGPPDPRDPGQHSRRERLFDTLGTLDRTVKSPLARADEVKRNTRNVHELQPKPPGFKSRDFH